MIEVANMESLASYGSDDEQDFETDAEKMGRNSGEKRVQNNAKERRDEDNYDAIGMELSDEEEESRTPSREERSLKVRRLRERSTSHGHETRSQSKEIELKTKSKSHRDEKYRRSDEYKSKRRSRSSSKERRSKERKHKEHKRSRSPRDSYERRRDNRERKHSRDHKRSSSRDRRKSESKHRRSRSRERRDRERDRSRSPPRYSGGDRGYKNRFDRTSNKLAVLEKLGIEIKTPDCQFVTPQMLMQKTFTNKVEEVKNSTGIELPKYYNPAIMNPTRYAEQIQKRRLLWGGTGGGKTETTSATTSATTTVTATNRAPKWEQTKFVHDNDGKVASKFKRLMGIKEDNPAFGKPTNEALKKQEEMFHSMEAQYEVARAATHTMRGVGLGFGAFTGNFPR